MELLDVLNEKGEFTGETMDRKKIHDLGIWHRCVHIWIINSKGELLIQQRAKPLSFGGMWDISAGGHVTAGETNQEAAAKEVREELGLEIPFSEFTFLENLKIAASMNDGKGTNHFEAVYLIKKDLNIEDLVLQKEEVEKVEFVPWQELKNRIVEEKDNFVNRSQEFEMLFDYLEKNF